MVQDNKVSQKVLSLFLKNLHFNGMTLDKALRAMVLKFRMPGEAQQIDRCSTNAKGSEVTKQSQMGKEGTSAGTIT